MNELEEVNAILTATQLLMNDSDERFFDRFGLGITRYYTLVHLDQSPNLTLSELSQRLLCTKGNMTRILKSMEAEGLLQRRADSMDGRAVRHMLTESGKALLNNVRGEYHAHLEQRFSGLELYEIDSLERILTRFNRRLEAMLRPHE